MRERWWGSSGRKVPEIALEGDSTVALDEALVVDNVVDVDALRDAHAAGRPVVVRAAEQDAVVAALARPEVSCVLVPQSKRELLDLDLTQLTYG